MSAPGLRELQRLFMDALTAAAVTPGLPAGLAGVVRPAERFAVYADMYFWRLREVLAEDYPKLAAALEPEAFTALARAYLRARPSQHPSVRHVGARLADHLPPGWTRDLARLEWARVEAFDAPDVPGLRREDLAGIPPEAWPDLRFEPVPALDVVESRWAVHRVWDDPAAAPAAEPVAVRVWRQHGVVWHAAMPSAEAAALAALRAGAPFAHICEAARDPEAAAGLLAGWLADGLLAAVRLAA